MIYRTVVEKSIENIQIMDVFSKLSQNRIIFIDEIDSNSVNEIIAQLLYLDSIDTEKKINIYINSPGGSIYDGLAIYDVVTKVIKSPVKTVGVGMAASMGAILMLMGEERVALPNCRFMLHQASGGDFGKTSDLKISYDEQKLLQDKLYNIIKERTNFENIEEELLKGDKWFSVEEALKINFLTKSI